MGPRETKVFVGYVRAIVEGLDEPDVAAEIVKQLQSGSKATLRVADLEEWRPATLASFTSAAQRRELARIQTVREALAAVSRYVTSLSTDGRYRLLAAIVQATEGLDGEGKSLVVAFAAIGADIRFAVGENRPLGRMRDHASLISTFLEKLDPTLIATLERDFFTELARGGDLGAGFERALGAVRARLKEWRDQVPSSKKVRALAKFKALAAVFVMFDLHLGTGSDSPFVQVCDDAGVSRSIVKQHIGALVPILREAKARSLARRSAG